MGRSGNLRQTEQLTQTLAWATRRGVPLDHALKSLVDSLERRSWRSSVPLLRNLPAVLTTSIGSLRKDHPVRGSNAFVRGLEEVVHDLGRGLPLADALEQNLRKFLPDYYVPVIGAAERSQTLPVVLANLTQRLRRESLRDQFAVGYLVYFCTVVMQSLAVAASTLVFIVPRFAVMFEEMLAGEPLPLLTMWVFRASAFAVLFIGLAVPLSIVIVGIGWLARRHGWLGYWPHRCLRHVPILGVLLYDPQLLNLSRALAALIEAGLDVPAAVRLLEEAEVPGWVRPRLRRFRQRLEAGEPWEDAWLALRLGTSFDRWLVLNAAHRERPADGFAALVESVSLRLEATGQTLQRLEPIAGTMVLVVPVGAIVLGLFMPLIKLISSAGGT